MKETYEVNSPSLATTVVNYVLNRFMPFICAGGIMIYACGYDSLIPYVVLAFMWYASKFSFDCGVASAVIEHEMRMFKISVDDSDDEVSTKSDGEGE